MNSERYYKYQYFRKWASRNGLNPPGTASEQAEFREISRHLHTWWYWNHESRCAMLPGIDPEGIAQVETIIGRKLSEYERTGGDRGEAICVYTDTDRQHMQDFADEAWFTAEQLAEQYGWSL